MDAQRFELPNGLIVLLAPDRGFSNVLVWTTFRAGTLYEPAGRSGLAHLVEHLMATGPTPQTDYQTLLETRGARHFNASTDFETMQFETVVPAAELSLALWVDADRLGSLPALIDAEQVERNRRVVLQERAVRDVDAPYGLVDEQLFKRLFAAPHPLHGSVAGVPAELAHVTAGDAQTFATRLLVPANGVLTIVGRFDPAEARRLIEDGLGRLPAGRRARIPALPPFGQAMVDARQELIAREPRVIEAWRLSRVSHDEALALFDLDTLEGRASRLSRLELLGSKMNVAQDCSGHWGLDPPAVRELARGYLANPRVIVHARPLKHCSSRRSCSSRHSTGHRASSGICVRSNSTCASRRSRPVCSPRARRSSW